MRKRLTAQVAGIDGGWIALRGVNAWRQLALFRRRFYRSDEPVAAPRHRLYVSRFVRRFPERLPQLLDGGVDAVVKLDDGVVWPELLSDFFAQNDFARIFQKHEQDLEGLLVKPDLQAMLAEFRGSNVHLDRPKADSASLLRTRSYGMFFFHLTYLTPLNSREV
jgi:hypothetical protein